MKSKKSALFFNSVDGFIKKGGYLWFQINSASTINVNTLQDANTTISFLNNVCEAAQKVLVRQDVRDPKLQEHYDNVLAALVPLQKEIAEVRQVWQHKINALQKELEETIKQTKSHTISPKEKDSLQETKNTLKQEICRHFALQKIEEVRKVDKHFRNNLKAFNSYVWLASKAYKTCAGPHCDKTALEANIKHCQRCKGDF